MCARRSTRRAISFSHSLSLSFFPCLSFFLETFLLYLTRIDPKAWHVATFAARAFPSIKRMNSGTIERTRARLTHLLTLVEITLKSLYRRKSWLKKITKSKWHDGRLRVECFSLMNILMLVKWEKLCLIKQHKSLLLINSRKASYHFYCIKCFVEALDLPLTIF